MILQIKNGTMGFGANELFSDVCFTINSGEKLAIIGKNGCGKTTFLKVLSEELKLEKGSFFKNNNLKLGYLSQTHFSNLNNLVLDEFLTEYGEILEIEKQLKILNEIVQKDYSEENINKYSSLLEKYENLNGYNYLNEIKSVFYGFGFCEEDLNKPLNKFSGGQLTKIYFSKLLLSKPDILLLDEPTNHLDLKTIKWLETYLCSYQKAIIIVSHDRMFINKIVNKVYEIEHGKFHEYHGNYDEFLKQKKMIYQKTLESYNRQQKDIKRLEGVIEKFRYKKNKASFAQSKIKFLDRMEKIDKPLKADDKTFKAIFKSKIKGGKQVLILKDYEFGYKHCLGKIDLEIYRGDRICIMGDNGVGKSTLLKTIADKIQSLGGHKMLGHQIEVGYFDQQLNDFNFNKNVLEEVWDLNPDLDLKHIRSLLASFLFGADDILKEINVLSGGEKVRLAFVKLMLKGCNFLILDEPTNHLDIYAKQSLENALKEFDGTILFVSHDRYFIKEIATSIVLLQDGRIFFHPDGYDDFLEKVNIEKKEIVETKKEKGVKPKKIYNLKKIENKIKELEDELENKRELRYEEEYYQDQIKFQQLNEEIDLIHNEIANQLKLWELAMEEEEKFQRK